MAIIKEPDYEKLSSLIGDNIYLDNGKTQMFDKYNYEKENFSKH